MKNTGNADLEAVVLNDPLLGVEDLVCEFDEVLPGVDLNAAQKPEGEEATGDETVAEALTANCSDDQFNHVITQEEVEAGEVVNVATAWAPGVDEKESTTTTEVQPAPAPSPEPSEEPTETPEPTPAPSDKPADPNEEVLINTGLGAKKDSGNAAIIAGSAVLGAGAIGGGLWALLRKRKNA